jgi:DNA-directed primase/polymerase protein
MEPRIFAIEKAATGKRKYIVGHLGRIIDYYWRKCDPKQRHDYELIREGTPCRLYLDLELFKVFNPDITDDIGDQLLQELTDELIAEFSQVYSITLTRDSIIDLDSSTDFKFSHHWITHLPNGELFADTAAAGRFVRVFVGRLAEEIATGQLARPVLSKYLFVANEAQQQQPQEKTTNVSADEEDLRSKTCFIDLCGYTRNRLFRILGSSKFGKSASAALRLASRNSIPLLIQNENFYIPAMPNKVEMDRKFDDTTMVRFSFLCLIVNNANH